MDVARGPQTLLKPFETFPRPLNVVVDLRKLNKVVVLKARCLPGKFDNFFQIFLWLQREFGNFLTLPEVIEVLDVLPVASEVGLRLYKPQNVE